MWFLAKILSFLGGGALTSLMGYLSVFTNAQIAEKSIMATAETQIITTAMGHKAFWIPWLIATVPLATWFGYGMVNTIFPSLPHVDVIPPGLLPWAQTAWSSLFYSGGVVASVSLLSRAIALFKR